MNEKSLHLSRRSFLTGASVFTVGLAGAALTGCGPQTKEPEAKTSTDDAAPAQASDAAAITENDIWAIPELGEPQETLQADVCIVGAGGTGTAAAIQAIDMGLKPLIIERLNGYGGSFIGTEGMTGLETHFTEADGEVMFTGAYNPNASYGVKNATNTCLNYHHWIPQHKLYENFFGQTSETIDWLESHGIVFEGNISIGVGPKVWHVYDKGRQRKSWWLLHAVLRERSREAGSGNTI